MAQLRRPAKLIADTILIAGGFIEKLESSDFRFLISQSHLPFSLSATDAALPQSGAPTSCRPVADPIRPRPVRQLALLPRPQLVGNRGAPRPIPAPISKGLVPPRIADVKVLVRRMALLSAGPAGARMTLPPMASRFHAGFTEISHTVASQRSARQRLEAGATSYARY